MRVIPEHFPNTKIGTFQIMPDHLHGIVQILELPEGTRHAVSQQRPMERRFGKPQSGSLPTVIGSFKSAATKRIHDHGLFTGTPKIHAPQGI